MKNLKFYRLICLALFSLALVLPANAQTKKIRKKTTVAKKKVVRKTVRPKQAIKIRNINSLPAGVPVQLNDNQNSNVAVKISDGNDDNYPTDQGLPMPNGTAKVEGKDIGICTKYGADGKISTVSGGVINGKAVNLPKPPYPAAAKAVKASGTVSVQVLIDEDGNVISANATSGHPLLRAASEKAAKDAKFSPTFLCEEKVKVSGIIVYNFVAQ